MTDIGTNAVVVFNSRFGVSYTITSGMDVPNGAWYDAKGNLYVANVANSTVEQYGPGGLPLFTYSAGIDYPIGVTTDVAGNLYVANFAGDQQSTVVELPQQSNVVAHSCSTSLANFGVAVSPAGDVFVSGNAFASGPANIVEYKGGLIGCNRSVLAPSLNYGGGLQIDKKGTLVACDPLAGQVDLIPRPYTSIASSVGGFSKPRYVALNEKQNEMFVADTGTNEVAVLSYPGGKLKQTLGSANGLVNPDSVATYPFARK